MNRTPRWISRPWLVTGLSLGALAVLALVLWSPWDRPSYAAGKRLRFYCAKGMIRPVDEIIGAYGARYGITVEAEYDGTGNLLAKMRTAHGGDLYLAADSLDMEKARREGLVAEVIPVAWVHPVLVVNRRTQAALTQPIRSVRDLFQPKSKLRVVLADPEGTAIGQLVQKQLEPLGLWAEIQKALKDPNPRVSTGGPVTEVASKVQTGDGYVGIVWREVAAQFPDLVAIPVPEFDGVKETVQIGVLTQSTNPTAALRFARFLAGVSPERDEQGAVPPGQEAGLDIFARHHYETVKDADVWTERPELYVSSGAMLEPAISGVVKAFEVREGAIIHTNYKGCGLLVTEMRNLKAANGRHFPDAYVSCDISFHDRVEQWFEDYAKILENDMVIIVPKGNPRGVKSLEDLKRPELRVGVPHPQNSALGELIDRLLMKLGLHEQIYGPGWQERVTHSDAAHTLVNQLRSGALDVAIVGRSNAKSAPQNPALYLDIIDIDVPGALATQTYAVGKDSHHKYLMRRLFAAIVAPANAERAQAIGFRYIYGK